MKHPQLSHPISYKTHQKTEIHEPVSGATGQAEAKCEDDNLKPVPKDLQLMGVDSRPGTNGKSYAKYPCDH